MCSCTMKTAAQEDFRLRAATRDDLEPVRDMLRDAGLPTELPEASFADGFRVAESPAGIVGAAGVEALPPYGLLRSVVVCPDWRGRGVANRLVQDRIDWARAQGLTSLYLLTAGASSYFRRFGFELTERSGLPMELHASSELTGAGACPDSCTAMARRLDAGEPNLVDAIRERYADAARRVVAGSPSFCGAPAASDCCSNVVTGDLYARSQVEEIPDGALRASLGCGNPTLLASLQPGELVLDLGSGGGIDVLLSARRVGPAGKAYGLDMTDEMLALARENQKRAGIANVEFLRGRIEDVPLPAETVDVIISNCVLNLSTDKPRAFREAFRVLKPGGRLAVSDIVVRGDVPEAIRRSVELWAGCVAGALEEKDYVRQLVDAGFEDIEIQPTRIYTAEDARPFLESVGLSPSLAATLDGRFMSAFIRGRRPAEKSPEVRVARGDSAAS